MLLQRSWYFLRDLGYAFEPCVWQTYLLLHQLVILIWWCFSTIGWYVHSIIINPFDSTNLYPCSFLIAYFSQCSTVEVQISFGKVQLEASLILFQQLLSSFIKWNSINSWPIRFGYEKALKCRVSLYNSWQLKLTRFQQ